MTNNFEIFVKGKAQTYLVHSRMKKNHKLFKEETPEHLELVKKAIKDIMSGKEPTLPESRQKAEGKGLKTAEEREAEAKARVEEMARKKEETEKKRKELIALRESSSLASRPIDKKEIEALRESALLAAKAVDAQAVKEVAAKGDEKKKAKKAQNKKEKAPPSMTKIHSERPEKPSSKHPSKRTTMNSVMKHTSATPNPNSEALAFEKNLDTTSAGSSSSIPASKEHSTEDKVLDAADEGQEDEGQDEAAKRLDGSARRPVGPKEEDRARDFACMSATQSCAQDQQRLVEQQQTHHQEDNTQVETESARAYAQQRISRELAGADVPRAPVCVEACIESKVTPQPTNQRDAGMKPSSSHSTHKDVISSFFAFACCRSPSLVDDKAMKGFEDCSAQPEVDACFVAA